ncbi:acetate--CoA ligase family protein [Roseomonas sp. GC11]|uniref:acetate--CoA ligase family protein n=1 Tax=Roseomonas sp. GC11 TaxID=2950546 RepID=UPI00210DE53A|nr:acetate--CoA ligase family protein [Roseomonas sp. GC11]MCQ4161852.1 acetate--CoA ligase family protein [Roseomonas sp. GC11]
MTAMPRRPIGAGLDAILQPNAIAIIGASQDPTKIGGRPVHLLQRFGYPGAILPVNPRAAEVQGLPAYPSVEALPLVPDLAIIAVAAEAAPEALEACAAKGVRAAVIFSSGFSELGAEGEALQDRLRQTARRSGIRVLGPNCLGALSIAEKSIATFSIVLEGSLPPAGPLGIISQSGNLGSFTALLARERGIGISRFITTGNECDVDVADGIAWLARDPATRVILCCLETCRDAPRLIAAFEEARRAGKPVVVLKIGASEAGQAAAASHTGALAGSDAVFDAVFHRAGVWRVRSVEQLLDLGHAAAVLGTERLPRGRRTVLLTASGGFGVLLADAASAAGLELPALSEATQRRILDIVPYAAPRNPVDATAQMGSRPDILSGILSAILEDEQCDALLLLLSSSLYIPRLRTVFMRTLREIRARYPDKVVLLSVHGPQDAVEELAALGFPVVDGVDASALALRGLCGLAEARQLPAPPPPLPPAAPLPAEALRHEHGAKQALAAAGVPVLSEIIVSGAREAAEAASRLGFPVVLKIVSEDLPHKTEVGGVVLDLGDAAAVAAAHDAMLARVRQKAPGARIAGVLVSPMRRGGTELILGARRDPVFGPVVLVGLGGIFAEILQDAAIRPAPVDEREALEMLRALKAFPVLDGARGRPRADLPAAARAIAALSRFAAAHAGQVAEIDINPLLLLPEGQGAVALDALIVPAPPAA